MIQQATVLFTYRDVPQNMMELNVKVILFVYITILPLKWLLIIMFCACRNATIVL